MASKDIEKSMRRKKAKLPKTPTPAPARNSKIQAMRTPKVGGETDSPNRIRTPKIQRETQPVRQNKVKKEPFRLSKAEQKELTRLRRSAAEKQRRLMKNYDVEIPRPMHARTFESAAEFSEFTEQLRQYTARNTNRFIKLGAGDQQFSIPRDEYNEIMQAYEQAKQQREAYYQGVNKKPLILGGQEQPDTVEEYARRARQTPGSTYYDMLNPLQFEPKTIKNKEQWERIASRVQRQATTEYWDKRTQTMYDNYITSIMRLQERTGFYAQDLIDDIREMSPQEFLQMYYQSQADFESIFYNTPEDIKIIEDIQQVFKNVRLDIINVRARRDM